MGFWGTTCPTCKGPALFFSFGPSIECNQCRGRYEFTNLMTLVMGIKMVIMLGWDIDAFWKWVPSLSTSTLKTVRKLVAEHPADELWMVERGVSALYCIDEELARRPAE